MTYGYTSLERPSAARSAHAFFRSFPVACFSLTLLSDIAYVQTLNLLWLHFSEWLLLAGLVFGGVGFLVLLVDFVARHRRPSWAAVLGGVVVMLLAILNSFVHTADGWTAVVPYGLTLSVVTVLAMLATAWLGREGTYHV